MGTLGKNTDTIAFLKALFVWNDFIKSLAEQVFSAYTLCQIYHKFVKLVLITASEGVLNIKWASFVKSLYEWHFSKQQWCIFKIVASKSPPLFAHLVVWFFWRGGVLIDFLSLIWETVHTVGHMCVLEIHVKSFVHLTEKLLTWIEGKKKNTLLREEWVCI